MRKPLQNGESRGIYNLLDFKRRYTWVFSKTDIIKKYLKEVKYRTCMCTLNCEVKINNNVINA